MEIYPARIENAVSKRFRKLVVQYIGAKLFAKALHAVRSSREETVIGLCGGNDSGLSLRFVDRR